MKGDLHHKCVMQNLQFFFQAIKFFSQEGRMEIAVPQNKLKKQNTI